MAYACRRRAPGIRAWALPSRLDALLRRGIVSSAFCVQARDGSLCHPRFGRHKRTPAAGKLREEACFRIEANGTEQFVGADPKNGAAVSFAVIDDSPRNNGAEGFGNLGYSLRILQVLCRIATHGV